MTIPKECTGSAGVNGKGRSRQLPARTQMESGHYNCVFVLYLHVCEGWPSGNCNARGREFKSWSGKNKFTKVMGSDGKL